ncbi:DUF2691 family protein [Clostridium sp.]|uniref:DUF2691 family protein n=1 Tax=Clostridium sp. TaxID=1506 RepID=UPI003F4B9F48
MRKGGWSILRGIKFEIPNSWGSFISEILNGICVEQYVWKISEDQVYLSTHGN